MAQALLSALQMCDPVPTQPGAACFCIVACIAPRGFMERCGSQRSMAAKKSPASPKSDAGYEEFAFCRIALKYHILFPDRYLSCFLHFTIQYFTRREAAIVVDRQLRDRNIGFQMRVEAAQRHVWPTIGR